MLSPINTGSMNVLNTIDYDAENYDRKFKPSDLARDKIDEEKYSN